MRLTFLNLVVITFLFSCKPSNKPIEIDYYGFVEKEIYLVAKDSNYHLKDSLGLLTIKIHQRLDTSYSWEDISDCSSCGWAKYRFVDKNYPKLAESGFLWSIVPDSAYQLTIKHKPIRETPDSIVLKSLTKKDTSLLNYHPNIVSSFSSTEFLFKQFKVINERPFVISAFIRPYEYLKHSKTLFIIAETNLKSRELYLIGECAAKDTTGFIDNMYKSFLSIRIKENP